MDKAQSKSSELILNKDGSIYHLHLKEEHIAPTVILVGDPGRVEKVSHYFDTVEFKIQNREFITHTGIFKNQRLTVLSTGIGTDNIDIVMNELDAVANLDLETGMPKTEKKSLNIVRIGTSGAIQADIPVGSFVLSEYALGFDGLVYYYDSKIPVIEQELTGAINHHLKWNPKLAVPYIVKASDSLANQLGPDMFRGITATATGFYAPQGRAVSLDIKDKILEKKLSSFQQQGLRITNFEMETSAIYALGKMMGHQCCTCCAILANRATGEFAENRIAPVEELIQTVLDRLVECN